LQIIRTVDAIKSRGWANHRIPAPWSCLCLLDA